MDKVNGAIGASMVTVGLSMVIRLRFEHHRESACGILSVFNSFLEMTTSGAGIRSVGSMSGEEMFDGCLREGWKSGRLPSEGFHVHRYREVAEGFVPGSDEPVLHALLFGMGKGEVRRRIVSMSREPLGLPDVVSARAFLRMEAYAPGMFRGEVHLVMTGEADGSDAQKSWQGRIEGEEHIHSVDGSLNDAPETVAIAIARVLYR